MAKYRIAWLPGDGIESEEGDNLEISESRIVNRTTGATFPVVPLPRSRQAVIDAGGLIPFTHQRLMRNAVQQSAIEKVMIGLK
jgi:hypothetical protein